MSREHEVGAGATKTRGLRALPRMLRRIPGFMLKLAYMARFSVQSWHMANFLAPFQIYSTSDCASQLAKSGLKWPINAGTPTDEELLLAVIDLLQREPTLRERFPQPIAGGPSGSFGEWLLSDAESPFAVSQRYRLRELWKSRPSLAARRLWQHHDHLRTLIPLGLLPSWRRSLFHWMTHTARPAHGTPLSSILWFFAELEDAPSCGADEMWLDSPSWQAKHPKAFADGRGAFLEWTKRYLCKKPSELEGQSLPAPFIEETHVSGVNLFGHFCYPSGLGEAAWQMRRGLEAAGVPLAPRDMPASIHHDTLDRHGMRGPEVHPVSIYVLPPEHRLSEIHARAMSHPKANAKRVAVWYWELERAPDLWKSRARAFQEIWAPTRFIRDSFAATLDVPIRAMLPGVALAPFTARTRSWFGLSETTFTVLFSFDMCSVMERKNPLALVRAFRQAFRRGEDALLVLKVSRGSHDPESLARLREEEAKGQVLIIDSVMTRSDATALMACCDAYASLHRSEGFGLTMAEAMLLGKPVVATGYSGNCDFMTKRSSYLVGYDKVVIDRNLPQYPAGIAWAEPNEEEAANHLRRIYDRPTEARAVALRGQILARRVLDPLAASLRVRQRLGEITGIPLSRAA